MDILYNIFFSYTILRVVILIEYFRKKRLFRRDISYE